MANSISYNTPSATAQNVSGVPKPSATIVDGTGLISRDWWRFLNSLVSAPPPEVGVTLGVSPTTYTANVNGMILLTGGTVSVVQLQRVNTYTTGLTAGLFPLSVGDKLSITYTVLPTATWFPR